MRIPNLEWKILRLVLPFIVCGFSVITSMTMAQTQEADDDTKALLGAEALQTARDLAESNHVDFRVWVEVFDAAVAHGNLDAALEIAEKYKSAPTLYGQMLESGANITASSDNVAGSEQMFAVIKQHLQSTYASHPEEAPVLAYNAAYRLVGIRVDAGGRRAHQRDCDNG